MGGSHISSMVKWNTIQEIIENKDYRHFFYFYNENHENTYFSEEERNSILYGKSRDIKNKLKALKVLLFYVTHWEFALNEEKQIVLLTDSNQDKLIYEQLCSDDTSKITSTNPAENNNDKEVRIVKIT